MAVERLARAEAVRVALDTTDLRSPSTEMEAPMEVWDGQKRPVPGHAPLPDAPFVAAFLVRLHQHHRFMSHRYLVEHPALVWVLGFSLFPTTTYSWGFDVEASLPTPRHFSRVLRELPNEKLQWLLDGTVSLLQAALPEECAFGREISLDTKHIIAWVRENNPKAYIGEGRYDKNRRSTRTIQLA